jgi:hypothetical protein
VCNFNFDRNAENVGKTIRYPQSNYIRHRLIVELLDDFLALHQRLSEPEAKRKKTNMSEEIHSSDIGCGRIDNLRSQAVWQFNQRETLKDRVLTRNPTDEKKSEISSC